MRRKVSVRIDMPEKQLDSKIAQILSDLRDGSLSKKEIANKNKVDLGVVFRVAKSYNFNPSQVEEKEELQMQENDINLNKTVVSSALSEEKQPLYSNEQERKAGNKSGPKAKLSGVSIASVYRYGRKFELIPEAQKRTKKAATKKKSVTTKKKKIIEKETINEEQKKDIVVYHKIEQKPLLCGMFAGRYGTPIYINKFIFDKAISGNNLFNFELFDDIVDKFIKANFEIKAGENDTYHSDKSMVLYLTGLSSALASIIKLTAKYGINLTLMHYNTEVNEYFPQKIWENPTKLDNLNPYVDIIGNYTTTTWYKCTYDDIKASNKFYTVQVVNFSSKDKNDRDSDIYIYMSESVMWKHYYQLLTEMMSNREKRLSVFIKTAHIENGKIKFDTVIGHASNFDYNNDK